jgi:cytoskeletal protein CcmA (bactofilin family)
VTEQTSSKTVLGADCRVSGELTLDNDAIIMGEFQGVLRVRGMLEITETARVSGTVIAGTVRLAGVVDAKVVAETGIELMAGAMLSGHLYTPSLAIVAGAVLMGEVNVGPQALDACDNLVHHRGALVESRAKTEPEQTETADESASNTVSDSPIDGALEAPAVNPVHTMPASLNTMLQRRRSRVISAAGKSS